MTIQDTTAPDAPYPVHVTAELDPHLSRALWLVKWLLAIPHYVVLWALWIAFAVSSVVAFFAILFTGRFPRALFEFNVGVMRWTWRVTYYAYGVLGTDRYPPFTLADVPDYPAHLGVDYPEHLSRGLVLVKWWLLALPHYLVVAFFVSGGLFAAGQASDQPAPFVLGGGLIGLLVLLAGLILLIKGRYPHGLFDLILGLQRWVLRVAAYAALMTDVYPPFRLDLGSAEGGSLENVHGASEDTGDPVLPAPKPSRSGRDRVGTISVAAGVVLIVLAGILTVGAVALWTAKQALPDEDGFFTTPPARCSVATFAITSEKLRVHIDGVDELTPSSLLGDGRVTVESRGESQVFVGIADSDSVETYLDGVARTTMVPVRAFEERRLPVCETSGGQPPSAAPSWLPIWTTYAQGHGRQVITWPFQEGDWTVVVMNADGSRGLDVTVDAGATFPGVRMLISAFFITAGVFLLFGLSLVIGSTSKPVKPDEPAVA
jgi:hypothetical protein